MKDFPVIVFLHLTTFYIIVLVFGSVFIEFMRKRKIHKNFDYFGSDTHPTEFFYKNKKIEIYTVRNYIEGKNSHWTNLYIDILYINRVWAIEVDCADKIFSVYREISYNSDYNIAEINEIIKAGIKHKRSNTITTSIKTKSFLEDEEN